MRSPTLGKIDNLPEIFSTHPGDENRSNNMNKWRKHVNCVGGKHCTIF